MPPGLINEQKDLFPLACPHLLREIGQDRAAHIRPHGRPDLPLRLPGERLDKGIHVFPLIAVMDDGERSLATPCPAATQNGLQADAVLILRPHFHDIVRMRLLDLREPLRKFFL
jgi:hypothetical protein